MKSLKSILLLAILVLSAGSVFGQKASKAMLQKAADKTEALNKMILAGDADLALSAEQTEAVTEVYAKMFMDIKAARKSSDDKETQKAAMKAARKAANVEINKEILTKQQKKAKKAGKEEDRD